MKRWLLSKGSKEFGCRALGKCVPGREHTACAEGKLEQTDRWVKVSRERLRKEGLCWT